MAAGRAAAGAGIVSIATNALDVAMTRRRPRRLIRETTPQGCRAPYPENVCDVCVSARPTRKGGCERARGDDDAGTLTRSRSMSSSLRDGGARARSVVRATSARATNDVTEIIEAPSERRH